MKIVILVLLVVLLLCGVACGRGVDNIDRRTVKQLDMSRYLGDWYEIARYDHPFERGLTEVRTTYSLRDDGLIEVYNRGRHGRKGKMSGIRGKAKTTDQSGRLRVSFFWIFYSDYNIMELGDDYEWAVIGGRSPKRLWILSRTPQLPAEQLNRILQKIERRGYTTTPLIYVEHPHVEHPR